MELRARDGKHHVILRDAECQSYLAYLRQLSDDELLSVRRDYVLLRTETRPGSP
jgi:hypothetical protein